MCWLKEAALRKEKHINMKGQRSPFALEVTNQEQFLNRLFMELWDYLALHRPGGQRNQRLVKRGKQTLQLANSDKFCDFAKLWKTVKNLLKRGQNELH